MFNNEEVSIILRRMDTQVREEFRLILTIISPETARHMHIKEYSKTCDNMENTMLSDMNHF